MGRRELQNKLTVKIVVWNPISYKPNVDVDVQGQLFHQFLSQYIFKNWLFDDFIALFCQ